MVIRIFLSKEQINELLDGKGMRICLQLDSIVEEEDVRSKLAYGKWLIQV